MVVEELVGAAGFPRGDERERPGGRGRRPVRAGARRVAVVPRFSGGEDSAAPGGTGGAAGIGCARIVGEQGCAVRGRRLRLHRSAGPPLVGL